MRLLPMAIALTLVVLVTACPAASSTEVDTSHSNDQGDFYGRLDIDGLSHPDVIYRQPVVAERTRLTKAERHPVYLRVRPDQAKHWREHCRDYDACSESVLFVREAWYKREYLGYRVRYQINPPDHLEGNSDKPSDDPRAETLGDDSQDGNDHLRYSDISPRYSCPAPRE